MVDIQKWKSRNSKKLHCYCFDVILNFHVDVLLNHKFHAVAAYVKNPLIWIAWNRMRKKDLKCWNDKKIYSGRREEDTDYRPKQIGCRHEQLMLWVKIISWYESVCVRARDCLIVSKNGWDVDGEDNHPCCLLNLTEGFKHSWLEHLHGWRPHTIVCTGNVLKSRLHEFQIRDRSNPTQPLLWKLESPPFRSYSGEDSSLHAFSSLDKLLVRKPDDVECCYWQRLK